MTPQSDVCAYSDCDFQKENVIITNKQGVAIFILLYQICD